VLLKLPDDEGRERAIGIESSAEQDAAGLDPTNAQSILEGTWRHVQDHD
jgi:hypothetical protein